MTDGLKFYNGSIFAVIKIMQTEEKLHYYKEVLTVPLFLVIIIWVIYYIEIRFGLNFNKLGIYPRSIVGFRGVFFSHFIHSSTIHLFNNSVPLFVLTGALMYFYRRVAFKVLVYGSLLAGILTWCIGRESYHIGISGVIYVLFSFILFSGILKKHFRLIALSLIVIFLYGSMIWYVLPIKEGMSWEGHLSGFLVGMIFAILYRQQGLIREEFQFSKTDFDDLFDEDGNFTPRIDEEEQKVEEDN